MSTLIAMSTMAGAQSEGALSQPSLAPLAAPFAIERRTDPRDTGWALGVTLVQLCLFTIASTGVASPEDGAMLIGVVNIAWMMSFPIERWRTSRH